MGFLERLREEREAAQMRRIQDQNSKKQHQNWFKEQREATKKAAEKEQENIRAALVFLGQSDVLGLLRETESTLQTKGYNYTILQVYAENKEDIDDYPPLLSEGDVVVHLRWGNMRKIWSWQRNWPGFNTFMDYYCGISVSVSSGGEIYIPRNEYNYNHNEYRLSLQKWSTDKDLLEDVLWKAYQKPFYLNYSDGESRKRHRKTPSSSPPPYSGFG